MTKKPVQELRALSIAQPWAELILRKRKPIEIRTWERSYRGRILIHASKTWRAAVAAKLGIDKGEVQRGAFIGIAELSDIRPFTRNDATLLKRKRGGDGWYQPGQFAWILKNVRHIAPIPSRGQLGLYAVPPEVARDVRVIGKRKKGRL